MRLGRLPCAEAHAHLGEVAQEVRGVVVDPVRAGARGLLFSVASRQQPDAERPRPPRGEHVPDAVTDHDRVGEGDPEPVRRREEEIGIGLGAGHLVARDHRGASADPERVERPARVREAPAGGDRPRDADAREQREELPRPRQWAHLRCPPRVRLRVQRLQARDLVAAQRSARLARQRGHEQATAHADAPVDAPHRDLDAERLERLPPAEHVLVDGVDQGAVEIEEHGGTARRIVVEHRHAHTGGAAPPPRRRRGPKRRTSASSTRQTRSLGRGSPASARRAASSKDIRGGWWVSSQ